MAISLTHPMQRLCAELSRRGFVSVECDRRVETRQWVITARPPRAQDVGLVICDEDVARFRSEEELIEELTARIMAYARPDTRNPAPVSVVGFGDHIARVLSLLRERGYDLHTYGYNSSQPEGEGFARIRMRVRGSHHEATIVVYARDVLYTPPHVLADAWEARHHEATGTPLPQRLRKTQNVMGSRPDPELVAAKATIATLEAKVASLEGLVAALRGETAKAGRRLRLRGAR